MYIERVQIEEGFLDGMDVTFTPGMNVIIGERGTGKTSLIELIRFCLKVGGYTPDSGKRSRDHALSILGSGQVTVTLSDGHDRVIVTRTAEDESPRASGPFARPIIFSQTEIETVGLQAPGRLRLLDSFLDEHKGSDLKEAEIISEVRSLAAEADALRREIEGLSQQVEALPAVEREIAELAPQEQELSKVSEDAGQKKSKLDAVSSAIASASVGGAAIERFHQSISKWRAALSSASRSPSVESWPENAGPDALEKCRPNIERAKQHLEQAIQELAIASAESQMRLQASLEKKVAAEAEARQLRQDIESLQAGAGAVIRQGQQLRERRAQLQSLRAVLAERQQSLGSLLQKRGAQLDQLDLIRDRRFKSRSEVASKLSATLGPRIRVKSFRAGQFENYSAVIADVLRGSGLRYGELSALIAQKVSPRELIEAADTNDFELVTEATGISKDRAARILAHLRDSDLGALATVSIEDTASLQLLDGADYKDIGELSTGQRCTVVLPLVLQHADRILIVDQPEDHIDNAFIADTLIRSVLARNANGQIIFSTHNANIPVLGNADRVIQLGSDGRRGFPILASSLDDQSVVRAITTVMEGGAEAFQRRASFYRKHSVS